MLDKSAAKCEEVLQCANRECARNVNREARVAPQVHLDVTELKVRGFSPIQ